MKDLKHYFASPNKSKTNGDVEPPMKRSKKSNKSTLEPSETNKKKKNKHRKRKISEGSFEEVETPVAKQKKRKETMTTPIAILRTSSYEDISKRKGNTNKNSSFSDSSKENSISNPEEEESILDSSNSLLNYFNKVDKLPAISQKSNKIIVEALVHDPPNDRKLVEVPITKVRTPLTTRLRVRRAPGKEPQYDIITSFEDTLPTQNVTSTIRKSFVNRHRKTSIVKDDIDDVSGNGVSSTIDKDVDIIIINENLIETTGTAVKISNSKRNSDSTTNRQSKLKHDGTLQSFFKSNRPSKEEDQRNNGKSLAKELFLQSGTPEAAKLLMKPKVKVEGTAAPFPKHTHVKQKDPMNIIWSMPQNNVSIKVKFENIYVPKIPWSCITNSRCEIFSTKEIPPQTKLTQKEALKSLKKEHKDLPVTTWYRDFTNQKKKNDNEMWIKKYRPKNSCQLLGNQQKVDKLKKWLESYAENTNNKRQNQGKQNGYDSGEEFMIDEDSNQSFVMKNAALISGPAGSGKTATVYAIANEIGYEVLELNASCNRNGKKVFKDFSEALQSHNANVISFDNNKKKKEATEKKKTLILIEDADILFNNVDEGYSQTVTNLAINSKRPVIFITNESDIKYLVKLKPHFELMLKFSHIDQITLATWLKAISIAEGLSVDHLFINWITWESEFDIRKSLLQLQFYGNSSNSLHRTNHLKLMSSWDSFGTCNVNCKNIIKEILRLTKATSCCDILASVSKESKQTMFELWNLELRNSTSLEHNGIDEDCLGDEIVSHTVDVLHKMTRPENDFNYKLKITKTLRKITEDIIPISSALSRASVCSDYLPSLRHIARLEKVRLNNQTKRSNRFNNYMNILGLRKDCDSVLNKMYLGLT